MLHPLPPVVERIAEVYSRHNEIYTDDYAYLRDLSDPRVTEYIAAENDYAAGEFRKWKPLQRRLFDEMRLRMEEDDRSVPELVDNYWYYARVEAEREYPLHCRRKASTEAEQVYLDENQLAGENDYFDLATLTVCPKHRLVAFVVDTEGNERYLLRIKDIDGDRYLLDAIEDVGEDLVWLNDAETLIYTTTDENSRPCAVYAHTVGAPRSTDRLLYREPDPAFFVTVWKSRSKEFVFIETQCNVASEVHYLSAHKSGQKPKLVRPREPSLRYYIDHQDDSFLVLTNLGAENFRVMTAPVSEPSNWSAFIEEPKNAVLEYLEVYAQQLIVVESQQGIQRIRIFDQRTGDEFYLPLPDVLYSVDVEDLDDFHASFVRINYSSMVTPERVIDYNIVHRTSVVRKQRAVEGYDPSLYHTQRTYASAEDGTRVPISLLHRRDLRLEGGSPLLLLGYGAYEESLELDFNSELFSLAERSVVVALAHVRGGGELGSQWHDGGRLENKENSFIDFLACAEHLIASGYTSKGRIAAWGASAGGLLVAVAVQRRPDLFASMVAESPFVDVVNTLLDSSLPLTVHDYDEFGNPNVEQDYRRLLAYSPYDNVCGQAYPPMLITTGLQDQRVGFWEALKWVARLRASKTDSNPLLLRIDDAGHYGETGRYREMSQTSLIYAFLLNMWGLDDVGEQA